MKIIHAGEPDDALVHLRSIAGCFGIGAELVRVNTETCTPLRWEKILGEADGAILDLRSLQVHLRTTASIESLLGCLAHFNVAMLLLVPDSTPIINEILQILTAGSVRGVDRSRAGSISFPESGKVFSKELAQQSFPRQKQDALTLAVPDNPVVDLIMSLDGLPSFVRCRREQQDIFVWSTAGVFDVHKKLVAEIEFETACDEYVPAIIFLRRAFGDRCWHNPVPGAGIVIDDPLLQRRYGFIDFESLLSSARKNRYHVTLAFIPWNHWRSREKDASLFLEYSDCFSICSHGCDHTDNEYGSADYDLLLRKNCVAMERMESHQRRTGVRCEPIMVCPQEKYSVEAMNAFSDGRQFLGVACTACMPRNLPLPQLTAADLLLPAQDSFFGFAVFKRHYSGKMTVFALALFLGRPAILVEHHEFFKNGPSGAEKFAHSLSALRPDLEWQSLAQTMTRTHARRRLDDGSFEVRFFTDRFELERREGDIGSYRFCRRMPDTAIIERVLVQDEPVPFDHRDGFVTFTIHAQGPKAVSIRIEVLPAQPTKPYPTGLGYQGSVAVRRGLSEIRDNWLTGNSYASAAAKLLKKSVRTLTGK